MGRFTKTQMPTIQYGFDHCAFLSSKALTASIIIGFFDAFSMTLNQGKDTKCPTSRDPKGVGIGFRGLL